MIPPTIMNEQYLLNILSYQKLHDSHSGMPFQPTLEIIWKAPCFEKGPE